MQLEANGKVYTVHFRHQSETVPHPDIRPGHFDDKRTVQKRSTVAIIHEGACSVEFDEHDNVVDGIGVAECNLKDNFSKAIGRAISFGRATLEYDDATRKALLKAYKEKK